MYQVSDWRGGDGKGGRECNKVGWGKDKTLSCAISKKTWKLNTRGKYVSPQESAEEVKSWLRQTK